MLTEKTRKYGSEHTDPENENFIWIFITDGYFQSIKYMNFTGMYFLFYFYIYLFSKSIWTNFSATVLLNLPKKHFVRLNSQFHHSSTDQNWHPKTFANKYWDKSTGTASTFSSSQTSYNACSPKYGPIKSPNLFWATSSPTHTDPCSFFYNTFSPHSCPFPSIYIYV